MIRSLATSSRGHAVALRRVLVVALLLGLLLTGLPPASALAATCQVTTTANDGGPGSLRALVANPGCATITFAAGVTQVPLVQPLEIARSVTLQGPGADKLTLVHTGPPGGVGIPGFPTGNVLTIRAGTVSLRGLTITGGLNLGSWGGGLTVIGAHGAPVNLTLDGVVVDRNAALGGGGIYASNASLLLYDTTLSNNGAATASDPAHGGGGLFLDDYWGTTSAYLVRPTIVGNAAGRNQGGGIRAWHRAAVGNTTLTVVDGTIGTAGQGNTALAGGGVAVDGGQATLIRTVVGGNRANGSGGGIYAAARGKVSTLDTTIDGNSADQGGGVYSGGGTATLTNTTVSGNHASFSGGLALRDGGTATVRNSTISGNSSSQEGGGLGILFHGTATVTNSTISGNTTEEPEGGGGVYVEEFAVATLNFVTVTGNVAWLAAHDGGGGLSVYGSVGVLNVKNSIIAGNLTNGRAGADCDNPHGGITSQGHNLWGDQTACPNNAAGGDRNLPALGLNITAVLDTTLADNGGPTKTHDLVPSSPAANRIAAADCSLTTDQRGIARPQWVWCDSGAVESITRPVFHPVP